MQKSSDFPKTVLQSRAQNLMRKLDTHSNIMAYSNCPNCYNTEKGTSIHECKECGFIGCFKGGGLLSSNAGCFSKSYCPKCGKSNTKQLDRL